MRSRTVMIARAISHGMPFAGEREGGRYLPRGLNLEGHPTMMTNEIIPLVIWLLILISALSLIIRFFGFG